jgi:hypothetical protein
MLSGNPSSLPLFVADWEGTNIGWRVWDGENEFFLSRNEFLDLAAWTNGPCRLVVEHAHLHLRGPLSVAQVYAEDGLQLLHDTATASGVRILAFPQRLTRRTRVEGIHPDEGVRYQELANPKQYDPRAIYDFVNNRPEVSLKDWQPRTQEDIALFEAINKIRFDMTVRLNEMRPDYSVNHLDVAHALQLFNGFVAELDEDAHEQFNVLYYALGINAGNLRVIPLRMNQIMSAYVCVFDGNQNLRTHNGQFIGVDFIWSKLLLMSPFHGRSGTARSNLMYWGLRTYNNRHMPNQQYQYMDDQATHQERRVVWQRWRRGIKALIRHFRDAGQV